MFSNAIPPCKREDSNSNIKDETIILIGHKLGCYILKKVRVDLFLFVEMVPIGSNTHPIITRPSLPLGTESTKTNTDKSWTWPKQSC